jgi:hypothetical protein
MHQSLLLLQFWTLLSLQFKRSNRFLKGLPLLKYLYQQVTPEVDAAGGYVSYEQIDLMIIKGFVASQNI